VVRKQVRASGTRAAKLLQLVHQRPGISRAEATRAIGVGTGAATELVAALAAGHLITESPAPPSGGRGRPTTVLGPHPAGPVVIAVSITYRAWRAEAVGIGGAAVAATGAGHRGRSAARAMEQVSASLEEMRVRLGPRVRGVGVSAPGIVRDGRLLDATTVGWKNVDLTALAHPGEAFAAGNDATLAAAAESARGNAVGGACALHLRVDAGLGGGVIDNGVVFKGAGGVAGEFGHMPLGDRDIRCPCGAFGCWGNSVDGSALARLLGAAEPADSVAFFEQVAGRAAAGDGAALAAVSEVAARLGRGIAGLVNGLDVDVVTVGGLACSMMELAADRIQREYIDGLMTFRRRTAPPILPAVLGEDGPLVGAAEGVWAELWESLVARRP
jgi:predicted NBD/HSP70 family sugar kinase